MDRVGLRKSRSCPVIVTGWTKLWGVNIFDHLQSNVKDKRHATLLAVSCMQHSENGLQRPTTQTAVSTTDGGEVGRKVRFEQSESMPLPLTSECHEKDEIRVHVGQ